MKQIDDKDLGALPGRRLEENDRFYFKCHPGVACFNQCCRNLNLFLYPYDIIRLKSKLNLTSDEFLDRHVDVVLREGNFFPDVLLRMAANAEKTCPFLMGAGCSVYPDRPGTCRSFPIEEGVFYEADTGQKRPLYLFRPPQFCMGPHESDVWTPQTWFEDQQAESYRRMTAEWADFKQLFQKDPWGPEGPGGPKARMAFMATYNVDRFRPFVFDSSLLKRFKVKSAVIKKARTDDAMLLKLGMAWVKLFVWGIPSELIRPKR